MNLFALDASTTAVGWAVFVDGEYGYSGVYVPVHEHWWIRIHKFGVFLQAQIQGEGIETVAYELATGHHGNVRTDRLLGAVEYEARTCVWQAPWPVQFLAVTASQVRATECHKKNLAYAAAVKGAPLHSNAKLAGDEADAIGVGLAALKVLKEEEWGQRA